MGKVQVNKTGVVSDAERGERESLWAEFLENYRQKNPVKYEAKRATTYVDEITGETKQKKDEFAEIPTSFQGKVVMRKTLKGIVREIY